MVKLANLFHAGVVAEAFDIKEQRKATDAAGKGLEEEYGRKKK